MLYACMSVLCSLLLWSCFKDDDDGRSESQTTPLLSVEEAHEFFENQLTQSVKARTSTTQENHCGYMPGDFTPLWSKAKTSSDSQIASVDIPINSQYCYQAIRSELKDGKSTSYTVDITQKIIVVQSLEDESLCQYLLTLIPDGDYYVNNKGDISNKFIHAGDKGRFSGTAIYSSVEEGVTIRVDKYDNGCVVDGVYCISDNTDKNELLFIKAEELVSDIDGLHRIIVASRNFGEDICTWCFQPCGDTCSGLIVRPNYCGGCGLLAIKCRCGFLPRCPKCMLLTCICNINPPGGGGTTPGGGSTGGGSGVNPPPPPPIKYCQYGLCDISNGQPCTCCSVCKSSCKCPNEKCHMAPCKCPCIDFLNGKRDPLKNMDIVGISGRIRLGDFKGRSGNKHQGIDLGKEGDPIFSMYDGYVKRITNHWDPNLKWLDYPERNSTNATGNRVEYECIVNNETIYIQCWHMQNVVIDKNMETKFIKAGTLIGYVGKTGSASSPDAAGAHLHLQIRKDNSSGDVLNPHNYIYSKYSKDANWRYLNNGKPDNPC